MQWNSTRFDRFRHGMDRLSLAVVGILFCIINVWLLLLSGFSTSYISTGSSEKTFFVQDSMLCNLISTVLVLLFCVFLRKQWAAIRRTSPFLSSLTFVRAKRLLLGITLLLGVFWVLATQIVPGADQSAVLEAAAGLHTKSYALFAPGEYISRFPHQIGMVTVLYALGFLFGDANYLVFQLCNVCGIVVIYKILSELAGMFGLKKGGQLMVLVLGLCFFPLTLYASFVYGNVLGLTFSLIAIQQELFYFRDFRWHHMLFSAVAIALAVFLKSNYLIFFIGMLLLALLECLRQKKLRILLLAVLLALFYVGQSVVPRTFIQLKTGYDMNLGMSSLSYIAMGLQENHQRASGWYNQYNDRSFNRSEFDADTQAEMVKNDISKSIQNLLSGKRNAVRFFATKTASQWNNPTFQCFWIAQVRPSAVSRSAWLRWVLSTPVSTMLAGYLNLLQFFILFGSLLSLLLCNSTWRRGAFLLEMIVIGGFLFHLFWEAKAQYTLSYFVLLLPCAVAGYSSLLDKLCASADDSAANLRRLLPVRRLSVCCVVLVGIGALSTVFSPLHTLLQPDWDTDAFQQYVEAHTADTSIAEGEYIVQPYADSSWCLADQGDSEIVLSRESQSILLVSYMDIYRIRFPQSLCYLEFPPLYDGTKYGSVQSGDRENTGIQEWRFLSAGEANCSYILIGEDSALTYDTVSGTVTLAQYTGDDNQKWRFATP
ncbi:MAG: hypothetical protein Q4F79_05045 [Eubacteriales bacterium]|nr:hypothetical protein [Eubacteriales bacterium]